MIPGGVYEALRCVDGLKRGRTEAREGRKVKPICDADILATIEHLPAVVADMVQLQRLTGARPGEICDIRPGDINRKARRLGVRPASPQDGAPRSAAGDLHWCQGAADSIAVSVAGGRRLLLFATRSGKQATCGPARGPQDAAIVRQSTRHESESYSRGGRPGEKYDRILRRRSTAGGCEGGRRHRGVRIGCGIVRHRSAQTFRARSRASVPGARRRLSTSEIYAERDFAKAANVARQIG